MLSSKVVQLLTSTPKPSFGVLPSQYARALYGTKKAEPQAKAAEPKGREADKAKKGPDNVGKGPAVSSAKSDPAKGSVTGSGPGAVGKDSRGEEAQKGATGKQQAPATNFQQKRGFSFASALFAQDSKKSSPGQSKSDSESFVSDQAKKNLDPAPSSNQNPIDLLQFYPEKPGTRAEQYLGLNTEKQEKSPKGWTGGASPGQGKEYNSSQHNPSQTGRDSDEKYLDEALSGKSGPLVGTEKGKRRFSTSAAVSTTKGQKESGMGGGHDALINDGATRRPPSIDAEQSGGKPLPDNAANGLRGTERERTGDDRKDGGQQKGFSTDMGPIDGGEKKPSKSEGSRVIGAQQAKRALHTSAPGLGKDEQRKKEVEREMMARKPGDRSSDNAGRSESKLTGGTPNEGALGGGPGSSRFDETQPPRDEVDLNPLSNVNTSIKPRSAGGLSGPPNVTDAPRSPKRP